MENKRNWAIISVLIALVVLLILISVLALSSSGNASKAKIENIVIPSFPNTNNYHSPNINLYDEDNEADEDENSPVISGLPDMTLDFGQSRTLDLDNYASDDEDSHSDLEFTIIYTSLASPDALDMDIDDSTHVLTINESNGAWEGVETVTIRVEDTDGNTDEDTFSLRIDNGSSSSISPVISGLSDISFTQGIPYVIHLNDYVYDADNSDSELTWTYTGNSNILISIDSSNIATFSSVSGWTGSETLTFRVTDPNGNYDSETIDVAVVFASVVWSALSSQTIDEDSANGTIVYSNIISKVSGVSSPTIIASSNVNFRVGMSGNDLVLTYLKPNWYGSETITLSCNGVTSSFTLNVEQLMDDCIQICSFGKCYEYCD